MPPQPAFVAPFVLAITHPDGPDANGRIFEVGAGYVAEVRWERSKGVSFKTDSTFTPSAVGRCSFVNSITPAYVVLHQVQEKWEQITDFDSDPEQ